MKDKYRLTVGGGLPLAGLQKRCVVASETTLVSRKAALGFGAAVAGLLSALALYRGIGKQDEDEPVEATQDEDEPETTSEETESKKVDEQVTEVLSVKSPLKEPALEAAKVVQNKSEWKKPEKKKPENKDDEKSFVDRIREAFQSLFSSPPSATTETPTTLLPPPPPSVKDSPASIEREESLLKKGRFTPEEKVYIKLIAQSSVSTSATVGRKMPEAVEKEIIAASERHGLDSTQMLRIASMESGGNPYAVSSTGAAGVYQFTSRTAGGFGLTNRFDYKANIEAGMLLAKSTTKSLTKAGLAKKLESPIALYIAHQIGARGAREVLSKPPSTKISDLSASARKNIGVNYGGKSKTVGEYLKANADALESRYTQQQASTKPSVAILEAAPDVKTAAPSRLITEKPTQTARVEPAPKTAVVASIPLEGDDNSPKYDLPSVPVANSPRPRAEETTRGPSEEPPRTDLPPQNFLKTKKGIVAYG